MEIIYNNNFILKSSLYSGDLIKSDLDQLKHLNVKQGLRITIINYRRNKKITENETTI
jgi:hypothetical protein